MEKNRVKSGNSCPCANIYFEENDKCGACFEACYTCSDAAENSCIECYSFSNRKLENGKCVCLTGFTENGAICGDCHELCLTCYGT